MLAQILEQREGVEAAQSYVTRQLERHPTMRVFHKLMDYHLNEAEEGARKRASACCATWWGAGSQQTALPLPEMRFYRSHSVLALSVLPVVVND
jgi:lipopolysaccharide biosynthesis regulator YciM